MRLAFSIASVMAHSRAGHDLTPISLSLLAARIVAAKRIAVNRCLTGQSFFIFPLYRSPRVVKQQRGGACRGAAISGGFSLRLAADDTFPEDDGWPPVPGGCRGDQRSACLWGVRAWADDADERHSDEPGGIRAANPAA